MQVKDVMSHTVLSCAPENNLVEASRIMRANDCGIVPVLEGGDDRKIAGVITDRDIVCRGVAEGVSPETLTVGECMSTPVISASPNHSLAECCELMEQHLVRRIPVVDDKGECCGMVSLADVARNAESQTVSEVVECVSRPQPH